MITNFALSLSFDGIELLHRVPRGWRRVGRVDVASETLDEDLKALREKALMIEPDGLRTKLVIPLDQIKYIAIDGTMTTEADIHAALEGETPYALDELITDSEKSGGRTHIAAVARETLQEAEAFAAAHGFQPVCFVAVPEPFTFHKEVFFGPTDMARDIVSPNVVIERDDLPVMVVGTRIKSRLLIFDLPKEVEEEVYKDDLATLLAGVDPQDEVRDLETLAADDPPVQEDAPRQAIWIDQIPAEVHAPVVETSAPQPVTVPLIPETPVFASLALFDPIIAEHHFDRAKVANAPLVAISNTDALTARKTAATAPVTNRTHAPERRVSRTKPALIAAGIAAAALILGGLIWTQQETPQLAAVPANEPSETLEVAAQTPAAATLEPVTDRAALVGPEIPQLEIAEPGTPTPDASDVPALRGETATERLTPPSTLAAAAADETPPPVQAPPAPPSEVTAQASVGAPVLRGQVLSPDQAASIYDATGVWLRAPRFIDVPSGVIPFEFQAPEVNIAPGRIAQPDVPPLEGLDRDLSFIAPADPPAPDVVFPRDADGFILATPEGTVTPEGAVVIAGLPDLNITPRPELDQSDLDRMALLAPAPEGVIVIAGRPEIVPPLRPADAQLPETSQDATTDNIVNAAIAETVSEGATPTPGSVGIAGLELQNSGSVALDPDVFEDNAIVDLRPRLRPQGLSEGVDPGTPDITDIIASIESDDATLRFDNSTSLAVVLSPRPDARPANFGSVVSAARAQRQTQPVATAAPVIAAPAVAPRNFEPVPGGVARAATQEDAIRLRDINLIGVYGRANARRALVRLSNGRYVRVEVGSALDGGQVTAIGERALNYVKRGRTYAIELPSG